MKWTWKQAAGQLWRGEKLIAKGYAGAPGHKNKTESEGLRNKGPIPRGLWRMKSVIMQHKRLGSYVIVLEPVSHDALKRSAFLVHADNVNRPGTASEGCIILDRITRIALAACVGKPGEANLIDVV